jgi:hypothetical protein
MTHHHKIAFIGAALVAGASHAPASAEQFIIKPLIDMRLRYEAVEQDGLARTADALTLRTRAGAEFASGTWRLLAEAEGTVPVAEKYFDGLNNKAAYPLVGDPSNLELNRLQLQYRGLQKTIVTLGRQRINLEDQRFVGSVGWRQNEQTFDAVRLEYGAAKGLKADVTYARSVRTIWGEGGKLARQEAVRGDNLFAAVGHTTPAGTISGFAVIVDQEEPIVSLYRQSSRTFGLRLAGARPLSATNKLSYVLSLARQRDHGRNPNDYSASYSLAELGLDLGSAKFGIGREVLGADDGRLFTSFQTPLATLHKFQGWADKLLVTPPNGVRDLYGSAGYGWKKAMGLDAINAALIYHRFGSDRLNQHLGNEWNAQLSAKRGRWTAAAKLADYRADLFATDTRKVWMQLDWAI